MRILGHERSMSALLNKGFNVFDRIVDERETKIEICLNILFMGKLKK